MIDKTSTRRRFAALASGALVAGGLVVAPAVAGLATATAAPVALHYTCSGSAAGQSFTLPGTATVEVTAPDAVAPGASFSAQVSVDLDLGSANFGPVQSLTGTTDFPLSVGGNAGTFTTKSITAPMTAIVFADAGAVSLKAPATVGDAPITLGTVVGHLTADPYGIALTSTCLPDAGQDLTVGHVTVSDDAPTPDPVPVPVTGAAKTTGTPKVGKTLTAVPGTAPDNANITFQWLANGAPISKATKPTLKLSKALAGKKVSVQVTYSQPDFLDVVQTSKAVKVKK